MSVLSDELLVQIESRLEEMEAARAAGDEERAAGLESEIEDLRDVARRHVGELWAPPSGPQAQPSRRRVEPGGLERLGQR